MAGGQKTGRNTAGLRPPWPKGVSGNPGGRPKSKRISEALREVLDVEFADGRTGAQLLADKLFAKGRRGSLVAIKEIRDTTEGKPVQALEHRGLQKPAPELESINERLAQLGYNVELQVREGKPN